MNYADSLKEIEIGDIVQVKEVHSLFGLATKLFTGKYTHTGLIVSIDQSFWVVELNGGRNHAVPYVQLSETRFDVFNPPDSLSRDAIQAAAIKSLDKKIFYGYISTIATGINEFFGFNRFIHWRNILDCSGYIMKILESAGWGEHSYITSPTKFSKELKIKLQVNN